MDQKVPAIVLAVGLSVGVAVLANAATHEPSGWSQKIDGPQIGPSGQSGGITWLENPAVPYQDGAVQHGPYRLLPPGALYMPREYTEDTAPRNFGESSDPEVIESSFLYVPPIDGFSATRERAATRNDEVISIDAVWVGSSGEIVVISSASVPDWMLPLDVYLYPSDSLLEVIPSVIRGHPAVVEQPRSGPASNVGHVRVWLDGHELVLSSPSEPQDRLVQMALELVEGK